MFMKCLQEENKGGERKITSNQEITSLSERLEESVELIPKKYKMGMIFTYVVSGHDSIHGRQKYVTYTKIGGGIRFLCGQSQTEIT